MAKPDFRQLGLSAVVLTDSMITAAFQSSDEWLTRRKIADRVWRKYTPSFVARLEKMVMAGLLVRAETTLANGQKMFAYKLGKDSNRG